MSRKQDETISVMDTERILQQISEMNLLPEELSPSRDHVSPPTLTTTTATIGTLTHGQGSARANATETLLRDSDSDISQSQVLLKDHSPFMDSSSPTFSSTLSSLPLTPLPPSSFFPSNPASLSFPSSSFSATTVVSAPLPPLLDSQLKAEPPTGLTPSHHSAAKPDRPVPRHKPEHKPEHNLEHKAGHKTHTFASQHTFLLGRHYPFRFLVITPFRLCHDPVLKTERCALYHFGFVLDSLRTVSFQSLIVAYSLPLLCVFTPGLVLPLSLFQLLRVIAAVGLDQEKAGSLKRMESSSSSSSAHQGQATPGTSSGRTNHTHSHSHSHAHNAQDNSNNNNNNHNHHSQQSNPYQYQSYQPSQAHFSRNSRDLMFDRDEDDQSDGSEGEGDPGYEEIEYWLQRCSICFDSRLDFCLEYCRDQFCRDCFQRYVKEVVSNSWGLDVTKIKCPVCQDAIPLAEWSKYVDQATRDQYQLYNQPYRSFSRFCNGCDEEVFVSQVKKTLVGAPAKEMLPSFESLFSTLKSIITLGGFSHDDSQQESPSTSRKPNSHFEKKNSLAQVLVKKFSDDYQSLCTAPPMAQSRFPLIAHSYLSGLSFRSLVVPPEQQQSQSQPYLPPSLPQTFRAPVPTVVIPPSLPPAGASFGQSSNLARRDASTPTGTAMQRSAPQRRQGPTGVLEIYQSLIISLLELFDLQDIDGSRAKEGKVREPGFEVPDSIGGDIQSSQEPIPTSSQSTSEPAGSKTTLKRARTTTHKVMTRNQSKRESEIKKKIVAFSKDLLSLETRPDQWKELQFLHVRWLRWDWCHKCQLEICLQCGQSTHHENQDCFGHMRSLIDGETIALDSRRKRVKADEKTSTTTKGKSRSDQETTTLQWKLKNTNPCPNCCILIHRDDGCNKVDCMLCGYRFCWVCREAWGVDCGFYKCGRQTEDSSLDLSLEKKKEEGQVNRVHGNGNEVQEEQVESLDILTTSTGEINPSPDRHGARPEESLLGLVTPTLSDKPEIGVPNVFVIQQKRARF